MMDISPMSGREISQISPADLINEIGTTAVAEACGVSVQTARRWRRCLPADRTEQLARLAEDHGMTIAHERQSTSLSLSVSQDQTRIRRPDHEMAAVTLAEREVALAESHVDLCAFEARGMPPDQPLPFYAWRLAGLALLDLPPISLAFVTVAQVSPIMAFVSALGLAVFLILAAHAVGHLLQQLSEYLPTWIPRLIGLITLAAFLAAMVFAILDLRAKGLEAGDLSDGSASVFADMPPYDLPAPFQRAILLATGLVTIGSLIFAIAWSYIYHGPQADYARAEKAYRKSLRHLEKIRRKVHRASLTIGIVFAAILIIGQPKAIAATCPGKDVLVLLDVTTAYDDKDRHRVMSAVDIMAASLSPGDRLRVQTVRDSIDASRKLFDDCLPGSSTMLAWLTASPLAQAKEQRAFFADLRQAIEGPLSQHHESQSTALAATLAAHTPADAIWLLSDLLETDVTDADALFEGNLAGPALPDMPGVIVNVAGIGRYHDANRQALTQQQLGGLIEAWSRYLDTAGAKLRLLDSSR